MQRRVRLLARVRDLMRSDTEDRTEPASPPPPRPAPRRPPRPSAQELKAKADMEHLEAEARYHRDRLALYHARVVSSKPTSATRLRELQRISTSADERLAHAKRS